MRRTYSFVLPILFFLISCQPQPTQTITIIDGNQIHQLTTTERVPASLLTQTDIHLATNDIVLLNGKPVALNQTMQAAQTYTLQVQRAVTLTVNGKTIQTTAQTIGEALSQAGAQFYASDQINPPIQTPVTGQITVTYVPSRAVTVMADGQPLQIRSSSATVGGALAEAGIPLLGLDSSQPAENEALPANGQIQVMRVYESITLSIKSIPYTSQSIDLPDVALGQQQVLQSGQPGLAISRTRIRYEDGQEVTRITESESVISPPQTRIVADGTKIVLQSASVNGVSIQYWRVIQMYATVYSPCQSGVPGKCFTGTTSGAPAGKGVVAVDSSIYYSIAGQRLYVPGYGFAVVGDTGAGYIIEDKLGISRTRWIDLGFNDNDLVDMTGWVTVYFLAPAPASIPNFLK